MAYEKHTWETGEVITAEKLNNIETAVKALDDSSNSKYDLEIATTVGDSLVHQVHGESIETLFAKLRNGVFPRILIKVSEPTESGIQNGLIIIDNISWLYNEEVGEYSMT